MKKVGIEEDDITSHHLKGMGSITRPMTEEEKKLFQELVNEGFARFKEVVQSGRPKFKADPAALDKLATGQIFTADQAKKTASSIKSDSSKRPSIARWRSPTCRPMTLPWCATDRNRRCWTQCSADRQNRRKPSTWPPSSMPPRRGRTTSARGCRWRPRNRNSRLRTALPRVGRTAAMVGQIEKRLKISARLPPAFCPPFSPACSASAGREDCIGRREPPGGGNPSG